MKKLTKSELISEFITHIGDMLFYPALIAYALYFDKSPMFLALIAASEHLPSILAPVYGYLADKVDKKVRSLFIIAVIQAILYLIVAFIINDVSELVFTLLIVINFISGSLNRSYNATSITLVINELKDENEIKQYRSMSISIRTVVMIIGQLLGAALLLYISAQSLAIINLISFLLPIFLVLKFLKYYRKSEESLRIKRAGIQTQTPLDILKEVMGKKELTQLLFFVGMINFVVIPLSTVFIPETLKRINIEETVIPLYYAITIAAFGIATIVGVMVSQKMKIHNKSIFSILVNLIFLICIYYVLTSFVQSYYQLVLLALLYGVTIGVFNVYSETYFYSNIPVEKTAVYNGVMQSVTLGAGVISSLLSGVLIGTIGVHYTFLLYGFLLLVLGIIGKQMKSGSKVEGKNERLA